MGETAFEFYLPDPENEAGEWIGVLDYSREPAPPFELCPRYSERGELQCAGLRIGEGADYRPKGPVTRRMLRDLPLTEALRYLQEHEDSPKLRREVRRRLATSHPLELLLPRSRVPGTRRDEGFYIEYAERFAREARPGPKGNRDLFQRMAHDSHYDESTVRRFVRKGFELRPELRPKGIRERHVDDSWSTQKLTRKRKRRQAE